VASTATTAVAGRSRVELGLDVGPLRAGYGLFHFFFCFFRINYGGHRTASVNGHIYRDLTFEVVVKTVSVNLFCQA
jgi:hypothetical protein